MATVTFDTRNFVRGLRDSGFEDNEAEALTEARRLPLNMQRSLRATVCTLTLRPP
jgi:hypothetical protein